MGNSLTTGVTGLTAHRRMLDVVGNNLANVNSIGYKAQRVLFGDLLYETLRGGSIGSSEFAGGLNPSQIGSGVKISQVDRNFSQGNLELTGGQFDYAIQGGGFFVLYNGQQTVYTRAGAFAVDANQRLVDPSTGYLVQRYGEIGEPTDTSPGFQDPDEIGIRIPFGKTVLGERTTKVGVNGNLSANANAPRAAILTTSTPFTSGGTAATATTLLNDLGTNVDDYVAGDSLLITGTDFDGTEFTQSIAVNATTTLGDLVSQINGTFSSATLDIDADGNLVLEASERGPTPVFLRIEDDPGNTGKTSLESHFFEVTTTGTEGDTSNSAVEFFDSLGRPHMLEFTFQRRAENNAWDLYATIDPESGTVADSLIAEIRFNDDGSFQQVIDTGTGTDSVTVSLNGISDPQTIILDFGSPNDFDGITQTLTNSSAIMNANGFEAGTLTAVAISADGVINGVASNGRVVPIAQLAIAAFQNVKGLEAVGDSYFTQSSNSGQPQIGSAQSGARGSISPGHLESSNIDIALEFTRLIVAQRGFSANARTITVSDEVLEELTNIIR